MQSMQSIASYDDYEGIRKLMNAAYPLKVDGVRKHRDWIGYVYTVGGSEKNYVLKIYRHFHGSFALNSIGVIKYLTTHEYPVTRIVDTAAGSPYMEIATPSGHSIAILFEYIDGSEPEWETDMESIAEQIGILHNLMDGYDGKLLKHGKEHFIDRYINLLRSISFDASRIQDLEMYGNELWDRFSRSTQGFCHGDLHCGNMLKDCNGDYWILDFDAACYSHPSIDIAVMSDDTNYFSFNPVDFDKTARKLERFLSAYGRKRVIVHNDIITVYDFIAIRHFDIQATIADCQGYSMNHLVAQHKWLMSWRDLCERKNM